MQENGQVYFDLAEFIPEEDAKRHEEAMERHRERMREFLTAEAADRLERVEDEAFIHGS